MVSLNLILSKIILKIYLDDKFPKDKKKLITEI